MSTAEVQERIEMGAERTATGGTPVEGVQQRLEVERSTVGSGDSQDTLGRIMKGAFAGAAAVLVMDWITRRLYLNESRDAFEQEKQAQVGAKWGSHTAAEKLEQKLGIQLTEHQRFLLGRMIHYAMGIMPGMMYGVMSKRFPQIRRGGGLLFGLALFLLQDEMLGPMMGITSPPGEYPWQAHARGLVGHLALGLALDAALETLDMP